MLGHPAGWPDKPKTPVAPPCQGIGRVAFAVKNHNAGIFRDKRWLPIIRWPSGNAVVLEAGAPRGRPVLQFPLLVQNVGQIRLFIAKLLANLVEMPSKILQDIRVCPQLKAIDRRVARHPPRTFVVMNDEKLPWMGKKLIQRAGNDQKQNKKQIKRSLFL